MRTPKRGLRMFKQGWKQWQSITEPIVRTVVIQTPGALVHGMSALVSPGPIKFFLHIYYYTPLPLNLANKQASKQASNNKQQALILSVLAIAPPHRSGLYCALAILEPRWWPCQIQVLSQKLTSGAPGRGRQVGRCPPKTAHFVPQNGLFWPKTAPKPVKTAKRRQMVATLHVRLNCPVRKSPFAPFSSTICPRNARKLANNGLNVRYLCQTGPKPRTGRILGYVAQNHIPRARGPPATPHFSWFPSLRIAQRDA